MTSDQSKLLFLTFCLPHKNDRLSDKSNTFNQTVTHRNWQGAISKIRVTRQNIIFLPDKENYVMITFFIDSIDVIHVAWKTIPKRPELKDDNRRNKLREIIATYVRLAHTLYLVCVLSQSAY